MNPNLLRALYLLSFLLLLSCSNRDILTQDEKNWLKQNPDLRAAINPTYPPYQFINEQNQLDGIFIDFFDLIEDKIDYKFKKIAFNKWGDILDSAKSKRIDIIVEIQETNDRKQYLNFTSPLISQPHVIITKGESNKRLSIESLKGKTVSVVEEYAVHEHIQKEHPEITINTVKDNSEGFESLNNGKSDAFITFKAVGNFLINNKGYSEMHINGEVDYVNSLSFASRKDLSILSRILEKAVNDISDKEKKEIFDNWSYTIIQPIYKKVWFWVLITTAILLLLVFSSFANRYLKYRIKLKTQQLQIAKEKAEESDRLKSAFIQNISHEIRTPINGVIGFADILENGDLTAEEKKHYWNIIKNSGKQLVNIIDDILEISKLDTKQAKLHPRPIDLDHLMYQLHAIYEVKVRDTKVNLELHTTKSKENTIICIDRSKLRKVISNLIDNAVKFTEEGVVKISYWMTEDKLTVSVEDTGIGISENDQKIIFDRFKQLERKFSEFDSGLGLGLAIAIENTKLLNGQLTVKSKLDKGSIFTLSIPCEKVKKKQENENTDSIPTIKKSLENHNILIAEDGEVNYLFLKTALTKIPELSLNVYRAKNGLEAVETCQENTDIDLVFMDIKMPVMDGYEATRRIKEMRPTLPVVAQTAYTTDEDKAKAINSGCNDFISKPIDKKELKSIILKYF